MWFCVYRLTPPCICCLGLRKASNRWANIQNAVHFQYIPATGTTLALIILTFSPVPLHWHCCRYNLHNFRSFFRNFFIWNRSRSGRFRLAWFDITWRQSFYLPRMLLIALTLSLCSPNETFCLLSFPPAPSRTGKTTFHVDFPIFRAIFLVFPLFRRIFFNLFYYFSQFHFNYTYTITRDCIFLSVLPIFAQHSNFACLHFDFLKL